MIEIMDAIGLVASGEAARLVLNRLTGNGQRIIVLDPERIVKGEPKRGVEIAATPADIAFECRTVLMAIEDSEAFRSALIGTADRPGLAHDLEPGSVIVDFGVRAPRVTQSLLGLIGTRGISLLDAAIIGDGAPTVLVGGFPDAVEEALPLLSRLGRVERTGSLGSAHTAAALMGYVEAAHHVSSQQALMAAHALGLNMDALAAIIPTPGHQTNVIELAKRTRLARAIAEDRQIPAEIIDFTLARL